MPDGALAAPASGAGPTARRPWRPPLDWVGVAPFLVVAVLFLILPTLHIVQAAFRDGSGSFTLDNLWGLNEPSIRQAYWTSIQVSFLSALIGCAAGFALAAALVLGGLPRWVRAPMMTFSGVASNFAGVPLAFAFIASVGPAGLFTLLLRNEFGINLRAHGWNLFSTWGLILTYLYFQIPLMILIITPALEGLRREWREAAASLGATGLQYWRMVAVPILLPSILGTLCLLFANAFGAVATAMALAGPTFNIAPILLFSQIRGDVLGNPGLGYALALGMIVITGVANALYIVLRARSERWLR
ncbi:ABC transporter permease [Rubellimicrobium aerolatum]|uniref:ABC transporter permease n=1 Tax=Rubellimicrobium aerolatum TaxID=490979 RepID=A0ABW0SG79_9RHOB|nr:ABC transporter permease subunit [Rubellimicrobium aerolatum]MBP1807392.1 putative spermidine/putrescine transport system permease protein [Rubellimicrobium aerolatum]